MTASLPHRWLLAAALVGILAVAGCDSSFRPPDVQTPEALSVVGFLTAGDSTARVLVTRVAPPATPEFNDTVYVSTAEVFINQTPIPAVEPAFLPNDGEPFEEVFNYEGPIETVRAGERWELTVREGEQQVQGAVRIPGPFSGEGGDRRISWTPSDGADAYRVSLPGFLWSGATRDTTLRIPSSISFDSRLYRIRVDAIGPNLSAFLFDEVPAAGLRGGYGVFGGVHRIEFEARLQDR